MTILDWASLIYLRSNPLSKATFLARARLIYHHGSLWAMMRRTLKQQPWIALFILACISLPALGEDGAGEHDGSVFKVGPALERNLRSKSTSYGAAIAIERTIVEDRLELELGLTRLDTNGRELGFDVIFKKPFRLSKQAEFMVGAGPQATRHFSNMERGTTFAVEVVADFMYWLSEDVGWYAESSYGFGLGKAKGEHTVGASAGLLLRWK